MLGRLLANYRGLGLLLFGFGRVHRFAGNSMRGVRGWMETNALLVAIFFRHQALAYFYMVAAWGGYVFIINIIPIYVVVMVIAGRYSSRLYIAYSTFYALGSIMAMQVLSLPSSVFACPSAVSRTK